MAPRNSQDFAFCRRAISMPFSMAVSASLRAGDLDDAVSRRCERYIGDDGGNVVRRDGLEQAGESLTTFPSVLSAAMPRRNSRNWVERMTV
jgi:hypothetical protein